MPSSGSAATGRPGSRGMKFGVIRLPTIDVVGPGQEHAVAVRGVDAALDVGRRGRDGGWPGSGVQLGERAVGQGVVVTTRSLSFCPASQRRFAVPATLLNAFRWPSNSGITNVDCRRTGTLAEYRLRGLEGSGEGAGEAGGEGGVGGMTDALELEDRLRDRLLVGELAGRLPLVDGSLQRLDQLVDARCDEGVAAGGAGQSVRRGGRGVPTRGIAGTRGPGPPLIPLPPQAIQSARLAETPDPKATTNVVTEDAGSDPGPVTGSGTTRGRGAGRDGRRAAPGCPGCWRCWSPCRRCRHRPSR